MAKRADLRIKLFLEKVERNKWCFNKLARKKIRDFLIECELLKGDDNGENKTYKR